MRKYAQIIFTIAISMLATACANEDRLSKESLICKSIIATIDNGSTTRAAVDDVNIVWTSEDAIKVFNSDGSKDETWNIKAKDSGKQSASFTYAGAPVIENGTEAYAVFPASNVDALSSKKLTMTLPNEIAYSSQTVDEKELMKTVIPMWASWNTSLAFHHLAAMIRIKFKNLPVGTSDIILSSSTQFLSGTFTSGSLSETSLPKLSYVSGGAKQVKVTFPETTSQENRIVFIPIPANTYDLKLQAKVHGEIRDIKSWTSREFARGKLYRAEVNYVDITAGSPSEISDKISTIGNGEKIEVNITSASESGIESGNGDNTIAIPNIGGNASIGLNFAQPIVGTSVTSPLVITDNSSSDSSEAQNSLTITQPDASDVSLDISLPKTTVALESSGSTTVYKSITATTATNTLIIGHGVRVENLSINGGNIIIDGGKVDNIINNSTMGTTITATNKDNLIDVITTAHDITLGSKDSKAEVVTVGTMIITGGTTTMTKCKVTGSVTHSSPSMLKMTYSGSNSIKKLHLSSGSAGAEIYGMVDDLVVNTDNAIIDCKYGSSGCGIKSLTTNEPLKEIIWSTLNQGILSDVSYKTKTLTIKTSSSNAQVFNLVPGGNIDNIKLEKDINVFLTADEGLRWGEINTIGGTYDCIYQISPTSDPEEGRVSLSLDGETGTYYTFPNIKAAYNYAYYIKKNTVINIKLNNDIDSKDYLSFGSGYDVTINLNGYHLKFTGRYNFGTNSADKSKLYSNIYLFNGGRLTFTGNGKVTSDVTTDAMCYMKTSSATNTSLTFNGNAEYVAPTRMVWTERGKKSSGSLYDGIPTCVVNGGRFSQLEKGELFYVYTGNLTINGGEFNADGSKFTLNCFDANRTNKDTNQNTGAAKITVLGGRFYKFNPANNAAEGAGTNYVLTGYKSVPDGDWYKVTSE